MPSPLVQTKLYIPRYDGVWCRGPRLIDRLDGPSNLRLMLVSAPPGFGKTTLLASWVAAATAGGRAVAWVSLEETEQQPDSFWT